MMYDGIGEPLAAGSAGGAELVGLRGRSISTALLGHGEWAPPQNEHVGSGPRHKMRVPGGRVGGGALHRTIGELVPFIGRNQSAWYESAA